MRIWNLDDYCEGQISVSDQPEICIELQAGTVFRTIKAGTVAHSSFTGAPLTATVVFDTPFPDTTYVVSLSGQDARVFTYSSKTVNGFIINANSNGALSGEVSWIATVPGETI